MKLANKKLLQVLADRRRPYQPLDTTLLTEPRIGLIAARLRAILSVVQLESDGKPIDIDGFRLRDPGQWRAKTGSVFSELWHLSTACNMRCPFCYEEGDPETGSVLNEAAGMVTMEEIEVRLRYREPATGTGVFQPLTYVNEIFCNPRAMDIIERLRAESPHEVLTFVTNGTYLTEDVVRRLAALRPIFFNFSVNSLDPEIRRRILRDSEPETAIRAVELLRDYEIPYLGSLVCWPTIPWSDIEATVRGLDRAGCAIIRYSLSAYSRHLKGRRYERAEFWTKGLEVARALAAEVRTPIKIEPYHYMDRTNLPHVAGVIRGSPAEAAGLAAGDRVERVGGKAVPTANHALGALACAARRGEGIELELRRGDGSSYCARLDHRAGTWHYPYSAMQGMKGFQWGLFLIDNIKFSHLVEMRTLIDRHRARRVLVCSSELMRPIVSRMIEESGAFADLELHVEVPPNRFFGGTVILGDLLVVEDYVEFIREFRARSAAPVDLVIIPSSPFSRGEWQRDLTGTPAAEIARRTGVEVAFVHVKPLNG